MKKYVIHEIYSDGYERFARVEDLGKDTELNIHFLEYDEYLENREVPQKKKKGDILEGDISIDLVTVSKRVDDGLSHNQEIQNSPHIEATIEVAQVIDAYSIYAHSSILDNTILIAFEDAVDYKPGEKVFIIGTLEMKV